MNRPDTDELRHPDSCVESWWWWASSADSSAGAFVGFEMRGSRYDYWAGVVRVDEPYLYIEELDGADGRGGLEIKPAQMWADHTCEVAFGQWSLGNEAYGVLLEDPNEAWHRAYGTVVPVTFDIEWYAAGDAVDLAPSTPGTGGYEQVGEVDAQIELTDGILAFTGPGRRVHVWGAPYMPSSKAMPIAPAGMRAPYRRSDGINVDQVMTDQWWATVVRR